MWEMQCLYTMEYYPAFQKEETLSFVTAGINLEDIMRSKISQAQKALLPDFTYVRNLGEVNASS